MHLFCCLTYYDPESDDDIDLLPREAISDLHAATKMARGDFAGLVGMLGIEDIPSDWCSLKWEILNSYLIEDWRRARHIFDRAESIEVIQRADLWKLRGGFRTLRINGAKLPAGPFTNTLSSPFMIDFLSDEPLLFRAGDTDEIVQAGALLLGRSLIRTGCTAPQQCDDPTAVQEAIHDLSRAVSCDPAIHPVYRAMLAQCYLIAGRFRDAATEYRNLLPHTKGGQWNRFRQDVYSALVACLREDGSLDEAKAEIEKQLVEAPDTPQLFLQLAAIEATRSNFKAAAECVRRELEVHPQTDSDWRLSALLALGETLPTAKELLTELKSRRDVYLPLISLLKSYWPTFNALSSEASELWAVCDWLRHYHDEQARMQGTLRRQAAENAARAVEIELRQRVFEAYRHSLRQSRVSLDETRAAFRDPQRERTHVFCRFLLPEQRGNLALGQMLYVLRESRASHDPVFVAFGQSIISRCPLMHAQVETLSAITEFRNPAIHHNRATTDPSAIIEKCRRVLDVLVGL